MKSIDLPYCCQLFSWQLCFWDNQNRFDVSFLGLLVAQAASKRAGSGITGVAVVLTIIAASLARPAFPLAAESNKHLNITTLTATVLLGVCFFGFIS